MIAHARCRRSVTLSLKKEDKERGHKDFARIDLDEAETRATTLPEDGCIPQLLIQNREDGGFEKILIQKAATPDNQISDPKKLFWITVQPQLCFNAIQKTRKTKL